MGYEALRACDVPPCNFCEVPLVRVLYLVTLIDTISSTPLYFEPNLEPPLATGEVLSSIKNTNDYTSTIQAERMKAPPPRFILPRACLHWKWLRWTLHNGRVQATGKRFGSMDGRPGIGRGEQTKFWQHSKTCAFPNETRYLGAFQTPLAYLPFLITFSPRNVPYALSQSMVYCE